MPLSESLRTQLTSLVAANPVVLFLKGTRHAPQCGFSAQVVRILDESAVPYETVDVLTSPALRDGIKEFSEWPTIPQLYVAGQFVGGCDIVRDMHASGELRKLLGAAPPAAAAPPPSVTITEAAATAFRAAMDDPDGDVLHLQIAPGFTYDLFFAPREPGDLEVVARGVPILLDPASARLANGVTIDHVGGASGGFRITSPQEPARVKAITPADFTALVQGGEAIELFDVRTPEELALAKVARARHLDDEGDAYLRALPPSTPVAFLCHHGIRSRAAGERALQRGFKTVYNIEGGIDAWSQTVDPTIPRY